MPRQRRLGVVLLDAEHSVETLDWENPDEWLPPSGLGEGFFGHPAAWPLPVLFAVAHGATAAAAAKSTAEALDGIAAAVGRLDGRCDLIVGGCGYFGAAWPLLGSPPSTPTILSALDLLDLALSSSRRDAAVLSMSAAAALSFLGERSDFDRIRVVGLDHCADWKAIGRPDWVSNPQWSVEGLEKNLQEVLDVEMQPGGGLHGVGAVVLECTVLPQFAAIIRDRVGVPVYDLISIVKAIVG